MVLLGSLFLFSSCGDDKKGDEPDVDVITRVKDGNGKVFLLGGVLVDANLNFTQAQLEQAFDSFEWVTDYSFYYDNKTIAKTKDTRNFVFTFHQNRTVENPLFPSTARVQNVSIADKQILISSEQSPYSSASSYPMVFTVISLDVSENEGRIVMDMKDFTQIEGFDVQSTYYRMVLKRM